MIQNSYVVYLGLKQLVAVENTFFFFSCRNQRSKLLPVKINWASSDVRASRKYTAKPYFWFRRLTIHVSILCGRLIAGSPELPSRPSLCGCALLLALIVRSRCRRRRCLRWPFDCALYFPRDSHGSNEHAVQDWGTSASLLGCDTIAQRDL